jgi:hypothetical protein
LGIYLHDVPQDRAATDLYHRFRPKLRFFTYSSASSTRENDCFHYCSLLRRLSFDRWYEVGERGIGAGIRN